MAINTGVNVTKVNAYAVISPNVGVNASKVNAYAIVGPGGPGVRAGKTNVYAVLYAPNPPVWNFTTFATGFVGTTYLQSWDLAPASPNTTYTLLSGSLPPGLTLSNVSGGSGDQGKISGLPTVAGVYTFTLRATNLYGTADRTFTITILALASGGAYAYAG